MRSIKENVINFKKYSVNMIFLWTITKLLLNFYLNIPPKLSNFIPWLYIACLNYNIKI